MTNLDIQIQSDASLARSARIQGRIIGALLMREILTRFGRHNIGFMWLFVEPMIFSLGVLALYTAFDMRKFALPAVAFVLSGYSTVLCWRNTVNRCGDALEPNRALLHHRNVRVIDLYVARIILEISGATMSFFILSLIFMSINLMLLPDDILKMAGAWLLLCWFSFDLAVIMGALAVVSESFYRVLHVWTYLYMPLSGAFFMVSWLPVTLQNYAVWIPTVDCTELLREGLFGPLVHAHYNLQYIIIINIILMLPGLLLLKYISAKVEGE